MATYTCTIYHHSISRAPEIKIVGQLVTAKKAATRRFGDGFRDHEILIFDGFDIVSRRTIGDRKWRDAA